jgi:hypothetical protein
MDVATKPQPEAETLEQRGARINQEYLSIVTDEGRSNRTIVDRAIRVGKDLLDLKNSDKVPHGEWEKWVKNNIPQFHIRKVQRWMNLAENEAKIREEIRKRQASNKNDSVSFLTLTEALAIANGKSGGNGNGPATPCDQYDKVQDKLVEKLQALGVDEADAAATKTAEALRATVKTMKAGAKKVKRQGWLIRLGHPFYFPAPSIRKSSATSGQYSEEVEMRFLPNMRDFG